MTLDKINLVITTVWREENYLKNTLRSLSREYPFDQQQSVTLMVGSPETAFLTPFYSQPGITIVEMGPNAWAWIKNNNLQHRATWNYHRCLMQSAIEKRGTLILEDDIRFACGWRTRLDKTIAALEDRFGSRFVLTVYDAYGWQPKENGFYAEYPREQFTGTQAVYYPAPLRQEFAKYLKVRGVIGNKGPYDYLLRDFLIQEDIPLFAAVPSLIQHMGRNTTGLGVWHQAPNFLENVTAEPEGEAARKGSEKPVCLPRA